MALDPELAQLVGKPVGLDPELAALVGKKTAPKPQSLRERMAANWERMKQPQHVTSEAGGAADFARGVGNVVGAGLSALDKYIVDPVAGLLQPHIFPTGEGIKLPDPNAINRLPEESGPPVMRTFSPQEKQRAKQFHKEIIKQGLYFLPVEKAIGAVTDVARVKKLGKIAETTEELATLKSKAPIVPKRPTITVTKTTVTEGNLPPKVTVDIAPEDVAKLAEPTPSPPAAVAPVGKEPWQMTRKDYVNRFGRQVNTDESMPVINTTGTLARIKSNVRKGYQEAHKEFVDAALRSGKPVPPEVLADYPDLAAQYGKEAKPVAQGGALGKLDVIEQAARERIAARKGTLRSSLTPIPADDLADMVVIGAAKIAKGTIKFKDWSVEMVKEFGETIRPYLSKIWQQAQRDHEIAITPEYPTIQKIKKALNAAKIDNKALAENLSEARSAQAAKLHSIGERYAGKGQEVTQRQLGALKGKLISRRFEPIRSSFTQEEVDGLHNLIHQTEKIHPKDVFERVNLADGLDKLLDGYIPPESTLNLFDKVFGRSFTDAILAKLPLKNKLKNLFWQLWDVPKTARFTADVSFGGRQGAMLGIGYPKQYAKMWADSLKAIRSDATLDALEWEIREHPGYSDLQKSGLKLTQTGRFTTADAQNDYFRSLPLLEKIPGVGPIVKASNRNWEAASDSLKSGIFYAWWDAKGGKVSAFDAKEVATAINRLSGRGDVPGFERSMTALGRIFNAPRWAASQIQGPAGLVSGSKEARLLTARALIAYTTASTALLGLLKLRGASVSTDPNDTEFGKAKFGNTRIDLGLGRFQLIRTAARLITGRGKSGGKEYKARQGNELWRFAQGRLHPSIGTITAAVTGKMPVTGQKTTPQTLFWQGLPISYQDIADAMTVPDSLPAYQIAPLALMGISTLTYTPNNKKNGTQPIPLGRGMSGKF